MSTVHALPLVLKLVLISSRDRRLSTLSNCFDCGSFWNHFVVTMVHYLYVLNSIIIASFLYWQDRAKARQREMNLALSRASPELRDDLPDVLTPPPTKHKHSAAASPSHPTAAGAASASSSGVDLVQISSSEGELSNDSTSSTLSTASSVAEVLSSPSSLENLHL